MSFVERVVGHVRRVQQIAEGAAPDKRVVIDYGRHEARLLESMARRKPTPDGQIYDESERWLLDRLEWSVEELHWMLLAGAASELGPEERSTLVDLVLALAARVGQAESLGDPWLTPVRLQWLRGKAEELKSLSREWWDPFESMTWPRVPRYCMEVGLVEEGQDRGHLTQAGEVLLKLKGRDVVKWLLTVEMQMSVGSQDAWRVDAELLSELLAQRDLPCATPPFGSDGGARWSQQEKLWAMGLLEPIQEEGHLPEGWRLNELGQAVLEDVIRGTEGPMGVLAQAIREDELMLVVESKTMSSTRLNEHLGATILHARMVAHEVRNALGPVQHASRELRSALRGTTARTEVTAFLDAIDKGITRLHRFVTESVRLVPPESQRLAPFSVLEAIAEARKDLTPDGIGSLTIETLPVSADPRCHGNRGHFVMAMLNVLRNAQQAAGQQVQIAIRVDARNPQQLLLSIEDDGPGVPDAVREHIFENGVSYREDGTGHGLASLRAVVEDMGGKVRCSTSELGGAKFEIVLPMVEASP